MSQIPEGAAPIPDLTGFPTALFNVDGEIANIIVVSPNDERKIACFSSSPTVVMLEGGFPADGRVPPLDSPWPIV